MYVEYEADGKTIKARVQQKTDTLANWEANTLVLEAGEPAFVITDGGAPINFKIGDGTKRFSELPWWIDYAGGQYVQVAGNALPTPTVELGYSFVGPGTYTHAGQPDIVAPDGRFSQIVWNGSSWSLKDMGELPTPEIDKTNTISQPTEKVTTEEAVLDYSLPTVSPRALPLDYEFIDLDRPDLEDSGLVIVDNQMRVVWDSSASVGGLDNADYDRPDLFGSFIVDKYGRILQKEVYEGGDPTPVEGEIDFASLFVNFPAETDPLLVYPGATFEEFIEEWDDMVDNQPINPDFPAYITKSVGSISSTMDLPIYRYDFKPPNPTKKVILLGCAHGWEKNPAFSLRRWFSYFLENWGDNELTRWARWNVHFIVIPVLSPSSYVPNPYGTHVGPSQVRGKRVIFETDPIPCTWTRSGAIATITFNVSNFPDTDGRLNGASYFSHPGIAGKTQVGFISSSDDSVIPTGEGAVIASVLNGNTITVNVPNTGATSGSCEIIVSADPERNYFSDLTLWQDFTPANTTGEYPNTSSYNKGTRPFSLAETSYVRDLVIEESEKLVATFNYHSGPGNYIIYKADGDVTPLDKTNEITSFFTSQAFDARSGGQADTVGSRRFIQDALGIPAFTPEWSWNQTMTAENTTEWIRWNMNLLLFSAKYYK